MAASKRGLTWLGPPWGPNWGCGVFAPVPAGVVMFDGISEVKMVAEDGLITYLCCMRARRASLKPSAS